VAPALALKDLPQIDLLLLSHAHMDHMDTPSLAKVKAGAVVNAKITSDVLPRHHRRIAKELLWSEKVGVRTSCGPIEVESFEVKHWGKRWPGNAERGYNGYILRREGRSLIFGGDTAMIGTFRDLRSKGPFEAAIMPIGAYRPWIWNHCAPEEAWRMVNDAGAKYIVPVHHQTFVLSQEPLEEPLQRLETAISGERERLGLREIGETLSLA
jgi:L-ascorbate metabolism protein UlaG (beta-lactamase superfamily)